MEIDLIIYGAAYILAIFPSGWAIKRFTKKWRLELEESIADRDSLADAGKWIGILERILILTFVFMNEFSAIGFLIAAKSILRLSDGTSKFPRKQSEYVLIGTMASFTVAILLGIFATAIVKLRN